ncbi:MAG: hypothetical protein QOK26_924, partial [Pseudonocardiales bacterium]|nr:hypothetical protein [Pseudonocardiales bacterium]
GWGPRPADDAAALSVARGGLVTAPRMIPVYSHQYLPAGRARAGHPVLSIYRTDVICYGADLVDYLRAEFGLGPRATPPCRPTVEFWSLLM